ncbi:MAG: glycosyltransferase [Thermotogota bacterium]|nr:glycosyltransferase [Thermotogota bacterium]
MHNYNENKISVLFIIDRIYRGIGGTETQLLRIINGLDKEKFDVKLLVLMKSPWYEENHMRYKNHLAYIPIYKFKNIITYYHIIKLVYFIKKYKPHIVHTFFPISNVVGVIAARLAGTRVVISSRRDFGEWITPVILFFTKIANLFVSKIVTNSFAVKKLTTEKEGVNSNKIEVIYNGLNLELFRSKVKESKGDIRKDLNIPFGNLIIGTVANMRLMKRLDTFLFAAKEVIKMRKDVIFIIVGTGPEESRLRRVANDLNIGEFVYFAGRQYDISKYISKFDIAVNCSEKEGLSNTIMEYMAAGIPTIVSDAGGNPELIKDNINGLTFRIGDYKHLASKIEMLLQNMELKSEFKQNSLKILQSLDNNNMLRNYEQFYQKLT